MMWYAEIKVILCAPFFVAVLAGCTRSDTGSMVSPSAESLSLYGRTGDEEWSELVSSSDPSVASRVAKLLAEARPARGQFAWKPSDMVAKLSLHSKDSQEERRFILFGTDRAVMLGADPDQAFVVRSHDLIDMIIRESGGRHLGNVNLEEVRLSLYALQSPRRVVIMVSKATEAFFRIGSIDGAENIRVLSDAQTGAIRLETFPNKHLIGWVDPANIAATGTRATGTSPSASDGDESVVVAEIGLGKAP